MSSMDSQPKDTMKNFDQQHSNQMNNIDSLRPQSEILSRYQHLNQQRQANTMQQQTQQVRNLLNQQASTVTQQQQAQQQQLLNQQQQQQQHQPMPHQHGWSLQQRLQRVAPGQGQSQQMTNSLNAAQNRAPSDDWYP